VAVADDGMEGAVVATVNAAEIALEIAVQIERRVSALAEPAVRGRTSVAEDVIRYRQATFPRSAIC
jgi:hypothetical protein